MPQITLTRILQPMLKSGGVQEAARPASAGGKWGYFMSHTRGWMVFMALGLWFASSFSTAQTSPHRLHKIPQKQAQLPPPPSGPLSQIPMDQLPAAPPSVSYQNGLLTIVAQNSTLADILLAVRKLTGASIDVPPNATERVVTRLGPGPARDVLANLLNGTSFNYVMVGSASDPAALSALLLTMASAGGPGGTAANTPVAMAGQFNPAVLPPQPAPPPVAAQPGNPTVAAAEADDSDDEPDAEDTASTDTQPAGQPQGPTAEQLQQIQQIREKLGIGSGPPFLPANVNKPPQ